MHDYENHPHLTATMNECLAEWGIPSLTDVQMRAVEARVPLGQSAIVCAPTSSGKTLIGELVLANTLAEGFSALYLVSHKALAEQKYNDFTKRFSTARWASAVTVGISTGDHDEGDVNCRLLISTYEKALGLVLSGRIPLSRTAIIADEFQILGDKNRGASVETLCALIRQKRPHQFVGLSATVENPADIATWLECDVVRSDMRDVALIQTICFNGTQHTVLFGQEEGEPASNAFGTIDLYSIIQQLVQDGLGPVLVFTESRREASDLAQRYGMQCQRTADGLEIPKQLDLFSEPTESTRQLAFGAERRVTFHNADLTPDERTVIEAGFSKSSFDVCFATSTLAAGVNFPFRTVIIPKLTYDWGDRQGTRLTKSEYRNMSGRAGRLGYHPDGRAILLPRNRAEHQHANTLVTPENDLVLSQLVTVSMRRTVLALIASRAVSSDSELTTFFKNTLYWHEMVENNPRKLNEVISKSHLAVDWLTTHGFIEESHGTTQPTPLGKCTSLSGLLPETAKRFADLLGEYASQLQSDFNHYEDGIIHWALTCPEFGGDFASRFLPWPSAKMTPESAAFMNNVTTLAAWDRSDNRVTQCVHAMGLFIRGEAERQISYSSGVSAGHLHRLAIDLRWVLSGLSRVSSATDLACPQAITNNISMLARRVRWGTPAEALDVLRLAKQKHVPGFGRQRVMALISNGLITIMDILNSGRDRLASLVGGDQRANALIQALADRYDDASVSFERRHLQLGREMGIEKKITRCNEALGTDYEDAVLDLLSQELGWSVERLDDGKRQNVPDILLRLGNTSLLIECKTVTRKPPLIAKEEAFAILQKASDYTSDMRRITLGKPGFDEHSQKKAAASPSITLTTHAVFMEGLMRVLTRRMTTKDFVDWLAMPGVTELSRLPGTPTYQFVEEPLDSHNSVINGRQT